MLSRSDYELFALEQENKLALMEMQYQLTNEGSLSETLSSIVDSVKKTIKRITGGGQDKKVGVLMSVDVRSSNDNPSKTFKVRMETPTVKAGKLLSTAQSMLKDAIYLMNKLATTDFNSTDMTAYHKIAETRVNEVYFKIIGMKREDMLKTEIGISV